jgi:enoyl-CoA hydratase / 3-hydroxyacyl-CoA dehydrogenase
MMRLIEVVEGEYTSPETVQAAVNFAQAIRKAPIRCGEAPGFVVNRILNSSASEIWRFQEENGLSTEEVDNLVWESKAAPVGPFRLGDLLGLDTVLHVAEHLHECYGDRFYVHQGMRELVTQGKLGVKTGSGFYDHGEQASPPKEAAPSQIDPAELVDRFTLKALVEACLVLEEGVATTKDIDLGMMAGAGIIPPPFARADQIGLDVLLERLERAEHEWGENFAPPLIIRRLVNQGRLGAKSGQGFFPYAQPDKGWEESPVKLETRKDVAIAWLDRAPANSISPGMVEALTEVWDHIEQAGTIRTVIFASTIPALFCAGADIKAFTKMDAAAGRQLLEGMHGLLRRFEQSPIVTIAAVNALAFGGGCELAMACDFRLAAESATFGQPEINLGIIPGFGGTQRLPRLVGTSKALEMNLTGDPIGAEEAYELGLANRLAPDHELLDTALAWARKLAGQAPGAVKLIKQVSGNSDLDAGIEAEKDAFSEIFASEDAREGITAFVEKRNPRWTGR